MAGATCLCFSLFFPLMDKGFCQSPAYRSKLTTKLQFTSCRGKLRRLWRPAVATHPPIAETPISAVSRWNMLLSETHSSYSISLRSWVRGYGETP